MTSAARDIRLIDVPVATRPSVPAEHGMMTIDSKRADPEANGAVISIGPQIGKSQSRGS